MPKPQDLEPEEQEFYELFSSLREQVVELLQDLTGMIFQKIELKRDEDARLEQPEPQDVLEEGASNLVNIVFRLLGVQPGEEDESAESDEGPGAEPSDEEQEEDSD